MYGAIKGLYARCVIDALRAEGDSRVVDRFAREIGLPARLAALEDYLVPDLVFLMEECLKHFHPHRPVGEGMFRHGHAGFVAFSQSVLGRLGIGLFARDLDKFRARIPAYFKAAQDLGRMAVRDLGERWFRAEFREFLTYPELNHGIVSAGARHLVPDAVVTLSVLRFEHLGRGRLFADFDIDVRWR